MANKYNIGLDGAPIGRPFVFVRPWLRLLLKIGNGFELQDVSIWLKTFGPFFDLVNQLIVTVDVKEIETYR